MLYSSKFKFHRFTRIPIYFSHNTQSHTAATGRRRRSAIQRNMSSACTTQRLICNITSCFFARRLRLEKKPDAFNRKSPETSDGSIVFDFTGGGGGRRAKKSDQNGGKSVRSCSSHSNRSNGGEAEPHIAEEDYLVFCFGEDGAIDIIDDDEEDESMTTADAVDLQKGGEKLSKDDEIIKERKNFEVEGQKNRSMMENFEPCDSNLSDTSSGSFAFPILKMEEWIGSPVHMPKDENQSVRLYCCRF